VFSHSRNTSMTGQPCTCPRAPCNHLSRRAVTPILEETPPYAAKVRVTPLESATNMAQSLWWGISEGIKERRQIRREPLPGGHDTQRSSASYPSLDTAYAPVQTSDVSALHAQILGSNRPATSSLPSSLKSHVRCSAAIALDFTRV